MKLSKQVILGDEEKGLKKVFFVWLWPITKHVLGVFDFLTEKYVKCKRALAYAKIGWNNRDFDSAFIFPLLSFKLKRIYKNTIDEGMHVVKKEEKQSLRICIKLLERLSNKDYGETFWEAHDKKWGDLNISSIPHDVDSKGNPITYKLNFNRTNVKNEEDEKQEREENRKILEMENKLYHQDLEKFWKIFDKYHEYWWD